MLRVPNCIVVIVVLLASLRGAFAEDHLRDLQREAIARGVAPWGHWGPRPQHYTGWSSHSNRLIPVYTFGVSLDSYRAENSPYRTAARIEQLYGRLPEGTLNPQAEYFDQTDVYRLQQAAAAAGKKYIVLIVFDGMDWQTTRAAAIARSNAVKYDSGRGTGLHFLDYRGAETDFGYFVTAPTNEGTKADVDAQVLVNPGGTKLGGYDASRAGPAPWSAPPDPAYPIGQSRERPDTYTDSASSATSLCAGVKTYNDSINVDAGGRQVRPIARDLQERGYAIGVVTSVPISHATPACAYANNVWRDDFQDLSRDLVGLPSVAHREQPLPGVDVLLGAAWGVEEPKDENQGRNYFPGNKYIAANDLEKIDVVHGGKYRVALRTPGAAGRQVLDEAARDAAKRNLRLFGMFGTKTGHLPFRTADGRYDPAPGVRKSSEEYTPADIRENPTLAEMTGAALSVLEKDPQGFWLMVEAGDVDWANHDNNIDCSIGAVLSGDEAVKAVTDWVEKNNAWAETAVIVTADHGHYLVLTQPEALVSPVK